MKIVYTIILFLLISIATFAQTPNYIWAQSAGGTKHDMGMSVSSDTNGNVLVTGYFSSPTVTFGAITLTNVDNSGYSDDIFIVKYDAQGNVLWAKSIGGTYSERGRGIALDNNGNSYITGFFQSSTITFGGTTLTNINASSSDIFIVKYDALGNVLWGRSAGGTNGESGASITVDSNGNSYITGGFSSPSITFGSITLTNAYAPYGDFFLVKYDALGNVLWAQRAGSNNQEFGKSITVDTNGNLYVIGNYNSYPFTLGSTTLQVPKGICSPVCSDLFIAKYDTSGNVLWAKSAGGTWDDNGNSIAVDNYGNSFITGNFWSDTITFGNIDLKKLGSPGNSGDIFVVKYDASGNVIWAKKAGGSYHDQSSGISTDLNGNLYLTGCFNDTITFGNTTLIDTAGYPAIFIAKYDASGNPLWAKSAEGTRNNEGYSVCTDRNNNVLITGHFAGTCIFESNTLISVDSFSSDILLVKLDNITGIEENNSPNNLTIYPNPGNGQINIISPNNIDELKITNLLGQIIYQSTPSKKNISIQLEKSGIYFATLTCNKQTITKKLIID
ncbi:MAG: SBBP repeat-containing protein [Bacteroidota bacterium]